MGGDVLFMMLHFVLWTIVIIVLEGGLINLVSRKLASKDPLKPKDDLELDEDVIEEEKRVEQYLERI